MKSMKYPPFQDVTFFSIGFYWQYRLQHHCFDHLFDSPEHRYTNKVHLYHYNCDMKCASSKYQCCYVFQKLLSDKKSYLITPKFLIKHVTPFYVSDVLHIT